MKKFKLLTSLSSLALVAASMPVVATSCANEEEPLADEYVLSGLNWDKSPTVDVTSYPNQWFIAKNKKVIVSHDDSANISSISINRTETDRALGCEMVEGSNIWSVTPIKSGFKKLALDFKLKDGTEFTTITYVVVNTNYPWTVSAKDNCTYNKDTNRVKITDKTNAATLNLSMEGAPSSVHYIVKATKHDGSEIKDAKFENGVLTLPANTFTTDDDWESFVMCAVYAQSGSYHIGESLHLNFTIPPKDPAPGPEPEPEPEPDKDYGILTFKDWSNAEGTGVMDYLKTAHCDLDLSDLDSFPVDNSNDIKSFLGKYVSAEVLAEGIMHYAYSCMSSCPLTDAIVSWKTAELETNKYRLTVTTSFTTNYIAEYGNHYDLTGVFNQTLEKDTTAGSETIESFSVVEINMVDGTPLGDPFVDTSNNPLIMINAQNPESDDLYGSYINVAFMGQNGFPYLYLPLNEFNDGKGLPFVGSHIFTTMDELKTYASTGNFPVPDDWGPITVSPDSIAIDVNNLLNAIKAVGIFADGLAQDAINARDEPESLYGATVVGIYGYTMWSYSSSKLTAKVTVMAGTAEYGALFFEKTVDFGLSSGTVNKLSVTDFYWDSYDWVTKEYTISNDSADIISMTLQNKDASWKGYNIHFQNGSNESDLRIPYNDFGTRLDVNEE